MCREGPAGAGDDVSGVALREEDEVRHSKFGAEFRHREHQQLGGRRHELEEELEEIEEQKLEKLEEQELEELELELELEEVHLLQQLLDLGHGEVYDLEAAVPGLGAELAPLQGGLGGDQELGPGGGAGQPQLPRLLEHS